MYSCDFFKIKDAIESLDALKSCHFVFDEFDNIVFDEIHLSGFPVIITGDEIDNLLIELNESIEPVINKLKKIYLSELTKRLEEQLQEIRKEV